MTRAQIIATIGPPSGTEEMVARMIEAGMDVARINFSHGTHETNGRYIDAIRSAAQKAGKRIPIIQDLAGPRGQTESGHSFDSSKEEITAKDLTDLDFGIARRVDYVAQSYVGSARDVRAMKAEIAKRSGTQKLIAKIERREALEDIDAIIDEADAIMIARGDLGLAVPLEELPFIEHDVIGKCNAAQKPVIVATEMLFSMTRNISPTRAEVTDIAYAILQHADAIMLSDETASGAHPLEAVAAMEKIAARAERAAGNTPLHPL